MTAIEVFALAFASVAGTGCIWSLRALRRSNALCASQAIQIGDLTARLAEKESSGTKLLEENDNLKNGLLAVTAVLVHALQESMRCRDFIDFLEPRFVQLAGIARGAVASSKFWQEKTMEFLAELKAYDAEKGCDAAMEFLSHLMHPPHPLRCP